MRLFTFVVILYELMALGVFVTKFFVGWQWSQFEDPVTIDYFVPLIGSILGGVIWSVVISIINRLFPIHIPPIVFFASSPKNGEIETILQTHGPLYPQQTALFCLANTGDIGLIEGKEVQVSPNYVGYTFTSLTLKSDENTSLNLSTIHQRQSITLDDHTQMQTVIITQIELVHLQQLTENQWNALALKKSDRKQFRENRLAWLIYLKPTDKKQTTPQSIA
jgi:hypothetical protein